MPSRRLAAVCALSLFATVAQADAVRDSFERMLRHEPTHTRPPVPAGTDPLVAALIEPLRAAQARAALTALSPQGSAPRR